MVNRDAHGNTDFVGPCVSTANGTRPVVHGNHARCSAQLLVNLHGQIAHPDFFEQWKHCVIHGCDGRVQTHQRVGFVVLFYLVIGVIDDVPDDSVNTKRWFNDVREVPFSGFFDGFFVGLDVFLRYRDAVTAG